MVIGVLFLEFLTGYSLNFSRQDLSNDELEYGFNFLAFFISSVFAFLAAEWFISPLEILCSVQRGRFWRKRKICRKKRGFTLGYFLKSRVSKAEEFFLFNFVLGTGFVPGCNLTTLRVHREAGNAVSCCSAFVFYLGPSEMYTPPNLKYASLSWANYVESWNDSVLASAKKY